MARCDMCGAESPQLARRPSGFLVCDKCNQDLETKAAQKSAEKPAADAANAGAAARQAPAPKRQSGAHPPVAAPVAGGSGARQAPAPKRQSGSHPPVAPAPPGLRQAPKRESGRAVPATPPPPPSLGAQTEEAECELCGKKFHRRFDGPTICPDCGG